jgi:predicted nucleic acid-binding protein
MLIYLDMCSIQRPLDDNTQFRVRPEAEAVLSIIKFCESGQAALVSSDALEFEMERNPYPVRKAHSLDILARSQSIIRLTAEIESLSWTFTQTGLKPLDALHLACAVEAKIDYFCTCDDRFLRRARAIQTGTSKVVSPLELIGELGL